MFPAGIERDQKWIKEKLKPGNKLNLDLEEIKQDVKRIKSKKAPRVDCISSEMIKCSNNSLLNKIETLLILFIIIFSLIKKAIRKVFIHSFC